MTNYYRTDRTFMTRRSGIVNHLKNGGFMTARSYTPVNHAGPNNDPVTKVLRTQYTYSVTDALDTKSTLAPTTVPGFFVSAEPPAEQTLGFWDVWGSAARVSLNRVKHALDGGNVVTVSFFGQGKVSFRQSVESFHKFLGKTVTVGLSGASEKRGLTLTIKIDAGTQVLSSRSFFSDYFGEHYRMLAAFDVPLNATKFDLVVEMVGVADCYADISGATLALGSYAGEIPFSENLSDVAIPPGTVVGWMGEACPAGYRSIGEDVYPIQTLGDPNAVRGNLYAGAGTTVGTLGPRGALELGGHGHQHVGVTSYLNSAYVIGGIGFDMLKAYAAIIDINSSVVGLEVLARSNSYVHKLLIDRHIDTPPWDRLPVIPDGAPHTPHRHSFRFSADNIEPPRIRMRLCEKI